MFFSLIHKRFQHFSLKQTKHSFSEMMYSEYSFLYLLIVIRDESIFQISDSLCLFWGIFCLAQTIWEASMFSMQMKVLNQKFEIVCLCD